MPLGPEAVGGEWPGTIRSTVEAMSEDEGLALADKIAELYASLDPP